MKPLQDEMTDIRLTELFEQNYERLRIEGGHQLSPESKNSALQQVLLYWRKLREVAEKVTETEVKLTLPNQTTAKGRTFGIEGVVDIVREDELTTMYDLKTHEADYILQNLDLYAPQLNIYAFIWQGLRGQELDEAAIISTVLPNPLKEALRRRDEVSIERHLATWKPLIPIRFDRHAVDETIMKFGDTVDRIEERKFAPPPVEKLKAQQVGKSQTFGTNVCRNCDARFSCSSYRAFAVESGSVALRTFRQYFGENITDSERDDWLSAGLEADTARTLEDFGR